LDIVDNTVGTRTPADVVVHTISTTGRSKYNPVGNILSGFDWIQEIIKSDCPYQDECGIEKAFVLRENHKQIFCYPPRGAVLIITTSKPYHKIKAMLDHAKRRNKTT